MNEWIIYIMAVFAVIGALDRIIGNRLGIGAKFEEGLRVIGDLSISMIGMLVMAPVIANILKPVIVPVFAFLGADPAMFAGMILANDMGGAPLAQAMASDAEAGAFSGLIVGAMMGVTVVFTIPAALGMIDENDRKYMAVGVLAGVITVPIGSFFGGLAAGYTVSMLLKNLLPIILFAVLIVIGLLKFQNAMIKGFTIFGKFMEGLILLGLGVGILEALTGIAVFPGMTPIHEGFRVVADIAMVLAGAFPLVHILTKLLKKPLSKMGTLLKVNETSTAGMVATLANSIPTFGMLKDMDNRGKIVNMAFAVSAAFVFGDHLGFTAGFQEEMVVPVIIGKLVGGVTAVAAALLFMKYNPDIKE